MRARTVAKLFNGITQDFAGQYTMVENGFLGKHKKLLENIRPYRQAAIAFSGGVDSTYLAYAAREALGRENVICITADAASFPKSELTQARELCESLGLEQKILEFNELGIPEFAENPPDRCYLCKYELFSQIIAMAREFGIPVVFEGSNKDDEGDFRPGMRAIDELGVKSPLRDSGLGKDDIRAISKTLDLPTWNKHSFACLASRFVYGEEITLEKLDMVGKAEQFLLKRGFLSVRVRIHGEKNFTARIETLPEEIGQIVSDAIRSEIVGYFKEIGFTYVTLDLYGYRTGSMNEVL